MSAEEPAEPPVKVSWSILRAHEECAQKAALIRAHKRGPGSNIRGYYHGMVVDSAMREYLADPARRPGQMAERIGALIDEGIKEARESGDGIVRWKSQSDRAELHGFCTELVNRLEPLLERHVLPYPFTAGKRFSSPLNAAGTMITLHGEMDLLVQDRGWVVWDLKGTRDDNYFRKVLGQLVFYDLAVWCEKQEKTRLAGLIQPMCRQPVLEYEISDDQRRVMLARILRYVADTKKMRADCKEGTAGCSWCEVNHACPRFKPRGKTMSLAGELADTDLAGALRAAAKEQR